MRIELPLPRERGDVESVDFADPASTSTSEHHRIPKKDERVAIRLHGHPYTYAVRVTTDERTGPRLTELTVTADSFREAVDYDAIRSIPVRRLAYTAAQWIDRNGGLLITANKNAWVSPEKLDSKAYSAAQIANRALRLGMPVRSTVAKELHVSVRTVDRLLAQAREEGWFRDEPLPKRPRPKQRGDTEERTNSDD